MKKSKIFSGARLLTALAFLILPPFLSSGANTDTDTIRIGLLVQDQLSRAAIRGAELAVTRVNTTGGIKGAPVKLVVRSMEGPWGTGSKQAVSLIFEEKVIAMIGSHDGRNAHLVEQVSAKARVVFLSAWSGDPTLAQAFIPWFFNCTYSNDSRAETLVREIYTTKGWKEVAVVTDDNYDSSSGLKSFLLKTREKGMPDPILLAFNGSDTSAERIVNRIKESGADCIALFAHSPVSLSLIRLIRSKKIEIPVYCSQDLLDENIVNPSETEKTGNVFFVSSVDLSSPAGRSFTESYKKAYGYSPGAVAAYAWDATLLLSESIRKGGTEREDLQDEIRNSGYVGVTGIFRFDNLGGRKGEPGLVLIKGGLVRPVKQVP